MVKDRWFETSGLLRLQPVLFFFLLGFSLLGISRLGLAVWKHAQISEVNGWAAVLLNGMRTDISSLCVLLVPLAVILLLLPTRWYQHRGMAMATTFWLSTALTLLVGLELATPDFMAEFGLRPNRIFLEYLANPREVLATLVGSCPISCVLLVSGSLIAAITGIKLARRWRPQTLAKENPSYRALLAIVVLLAGTIGVRSTFNHRPMNPFQLAFSTDPTVNSLVPNSLYSLNYALRAWASDDRHNATWLYGALPDENVIAAARVDSGLPTDAFSTGEIPTLAPHTALWQGKPRNLVIVLAESLGAQFVGSLGGLPLTPNYDQLSTQGWALTRLYATGTRSARGIEAVIGGFPPALDRPVLKRPKAQQDFSTLAEILHRRGYDTTFYYGGDAKFDNMREFFLGNGFSRIIEQKDFPNPQFVGTWGIADEEVFARADQELRQLHAQNKPFFGLIFNTSNHEPFDFPDNRFADNPHPEHTRHNAVSYADYALGQFFERAMKSPYWQDTVFLVVADHDAKALGRDLVPVDNFHIAGLILGSDIKPRQDSRIASQIDLAPTLLSLIGITASTPMIGRNLADPSLNLPNRAMMQYEQNFAWMQGEDVVVFQPKREPLQFHYQPGQHMQPQPLDPALAQHAKSLALWGSMAYDKGWHRLPMETTPDRSGQVLADREDETVLSE